MRTYRHLQTSFTHKLHLSVINVLLFKPMYYFSRPFACRRRRRLLLIPRFSHLVNFQALPQTTAKATPKLQKYRNFRPYQNEGAPSALVRRGGGGKVVHCLEKWYINNELAEYMLKACVAYSFAQYIAVNYLESQLSIRFYTAQFVNGVYSQLPPCYIY